MAEQIGKIEIANGYYRGGKSIGDEHWNKKSKNTVLEGDQRVFRSLSGRLVVQTRKGNKWVPRGVSTAQDIPENLRNVATRTITNKPSGSRARRGGGTKTTQTLNSEGTWVSPQKQKLALPDTEKAKFNQKYPHLDYNDPRGWIPADPLKGTKATRISDAKLNQLNYNVSRAGTMEYYSTGQYSDQSQSDMAKYSSQPKDNVVSQMKIIEGLNLSGNNPQQTVTNNTSGGAVSTDSDSTTPLNKTVTNQGNDQVAGSLKIWSRGGGRTLDQADAQTESWLKSRGVDIDQISKHNKRSVYRDLRARGPHIVNGTIRLDGGRGNQNKYNLKINQS